jgi:hypothetical protein
VVRAISLQSMETTGREAIYRHRNAVQTKPATSGEAAIPLAVVIFVVIPLRHQRRHDTLRGCTAVSSACRMKR